MFRPTRIVSQPAREHVLRVALVVNGFPHPTQAPRGIANLRTAKALADLVDLKVICLRMWRPGRRLINVSEYQCEGVPVTTVAVPLLPIHLLTAFLINVALYRSLGWLLLRALLRNCDLIHSVDALPGIAASEWAKRAGLHHVHQVIGDDVNTIFPRIRGARIVAGWEKHIHGVACVGRKLQDNFRFLYPNVRNVRTVYRGVNMNRFQPIGSLAGPLADRPPVRYLFLGGFPSYPTLPHRANTKGGETLLAAWQSAEDKLIAADASLVIAGPESDSARIARWREDLRQPNRVHIVGFLSPEMISAYIRSADVVLLPSMQEGLPGVAMEASACARPVFGSNVGGIPEVVVHEETGLLLPAGEVRAWKNALITYACQPSQLKRMGKAARERMKALFDSNRYAPQMLDLYHTALREPLCLLKDQTKEREMAVRSAMNEGAL